MSAETQSRDILCKLEATIFYNAPVKQSGYAGNWVSGMFYTYVEQFMPGQRSYLDKNCFEITELISDTAIKLVFYRVKRKEEVFETMGNGTQWQSDAVMLVKSFAEYSNEHISGLDIKLIVFREKDHQFEWTPES